MKVNVNIFQIFDSLSHSFKVWLNKLKTFHQDPYIAPNKLVNLPKPNTLVMSDIKPHLDEIEIPKDSPFDNDKFNRRPVVEKLTNVVKHLKTGSVIALDGKWGSGKTTFIQLWDAYLKGQDYQSIMINAWDADWVEDPIVAILGSLYTVFAKSEDWKSTVGRAVTLAVKGLGTGTIHFFNGVLEHATGGNLKESIQKFEEARKDASIKAIEEFQECISEIEDLRKQLSKMAKATGGCHPLVVFVDELDRCNPAYAVKMLECIKHLFSVPNVVYILSIDREQLCHSIEGYYGSSQINANEYLKRFVDFTFTLPNPEPPIVREWVFESLGLEGFLDDKASWGNSHANSDVRALMGELIKMSNLPVRAVERLVLHMRVALTALGNELSTGPAVLFLVYLKHCRPEVYEEIKDRNWAPNHFLQKISETLPEISYHSHKNNISSGLWYNLMAALLHALTWDFHQGKTPQLVDEQNGKKSLTVNPGQFDGERLIGHIESVVYDRDLQHVDLKALIETVEMTKEIKVHPTFSVMRAS